MMVENQYSLAPDLLGVLKKYQGIAVVIGAIGIAALLAGFFVSSPEQFLRSYLVGFCFWNGMALGCLVLLMIQFMTGGAWGMMARRTIDGRSGHPDLSWRDEALSLDLPRSPSRSCAAG
jgi:hypothetical protein